MTFEDQINQLAEEAIRCTSEAQAIELIHKIQALMHARIESVRGNLITLPPIGPVVQSAQKKHGTEDERMNG